MYAPPQTLSRANPAELRALGEVIPAKCRSLNTMKEIALYLTSLFALALLGCGRPAASHTAEGRSAPGTPVDSTAVSSTAHELVHPGEIPGDVHAACDSAAALIHQALLLEVKREDGAYFDSFKGSRRLGCRLTAEGSFTAVKDTAGPVGAVEKAFTRQGWRGDLRYMADGPDGQDLGFRRLDMLCIVLGRWDGGDDGDTDSAPPADQENSYEAIIECSREVASNGDAGVPDSIWRIAAAAGLDSIYAISLTLQSPPYLEGDFDGDGVSDAAVLIEQRATGKLGVAVVRRGTRRVTILAAGAGGAGPDDLSGIDRWDVFRKGTTYNLTIADRPSIQLGGDALWIGRQDSLSAFYVWTGANYIWEPHRRP